MFMFAKKNCDTLIISTIRNFESGPQLVRYATDLMEKEKKQKSFPSQYRYYAWEVSENKKPRLLKDFRKLV